MKIEMGKEYQTRDGQAVRILCTDGPCKRYPVLGIIEGGSNPSSWQITGQFTSGKYDHPLNLMEATAKRRVKIYVVIDRDGDAWCYTTPEGHAQWEARQEAFAKGTVEITLSEGEGLTDVKCD